MPFVDADDDYAEVPRPFADVVPAELAVDFEVHDGFLSLQGVHVTGELPLEDVEELELTNCVIENVSLVGLASVSLSGCRLHTCDLSQTTFESVRSAVFSGCKLIGAQMPGVSLRDVSFLSSTFRYANIRMATLERVAFEDCQLNEVDFYDSSLHHVSFNQSELQEVSLDKTRFDHVDLREAGTVDVLALSDLRGLLISEEQVMALAYHFALATGINIHRPS